MLCCRARSCAGRQGGGCVIDCPLLCSVPPVTFTVASEVVVVNQFYRDELPVQFCSVTQQIVEGGFFGSCLCGCDVLA